MSALRMIAWGMIDFEKLEWRAQLKLLHQACSEIELVRSPDYRILFSLEYKAHKTNGVFCTLYSSSNSTTHFFGSTPIPGAIMTSLQRCCKRVLYEIGELPSWV